MFTNRVYTKLTMKREFKWLHFKIILVGWHALILDIALYVVFNGEFSQLRILRWFVVTRKWLAPLRVATAGKIHIRGQPLFRWWWVMDGCHAKCVLWTLRKLDLTQTFLCCIGRTPVSAQHSGMDVSPHDMSDVSSTFVNPVSGARLVSVSACPQSWTVIALR